MVSVCSQKIFYIALVVSVAVLFVGFRYYWANRCSYMKFCTYHELLPVFEKCDSKTIVTFDIDDTLVTTDNYMARSLEDTIWFKICAILKYPSILFSRDVFDWFISIFFRDVNRFVFDSEIVNIIKNLRERGCMLVAISKMPSGSLGVIKNLPELRISMLKIFGINFDGEFPDVRFTHLGSYRGEYPVLHNGVMCANYVDKGKMLGAFLDYFKLIPGRVVSFEDKCYALNSLGRECRRRGISFSGYQCVGAKKHFKYGTFRCVLFQLDYLMKHKRWLSNKNVDEFCRK